MNMKKVQIYCMANQDRSDRVRWLLEELEVPYENIYLNKQLGQLNTPEYRKLNPMGRVPTIRINDEVIFESVGICLYLADHFTQNKRLAPNINSPERGQYLQWMVFSVASLEAAVAWMFALKDKSESEVAMIKNYVKTQCEIFKLALNPILEKQDFILPSGFSAADIVFGAVIPGASEYLVEGNPPIQKYMERLKSRPAAIRTEVFL